MGDMKEAGLQITPKTPGRSSILNPFDSPSDYHSLQEHTVASPSVFKSSQFSTTNCSTPGRFRWSIDQLAVINPVEIDPDDVHRQALYLSRFKTDKEVEEKRQKAIEQFFTKSIIVPSPWTQHDGKQGSQLHSTKCVDLQLDSPSGREVNAQVGKCHVACQTLLSLPVHFNLEQILGEYFRTEEHDDQSHENLSASSLRRKLFLDGNGSESDCSSPPSPEQIPCVAPVASLGVLNSIDLSPVRCRSPAETPPSGQFSSSPIQNGTRAYSLGSTTSPPFSEKLSPHDMSPAFSPITYKGKSPGVDQENLTHPSLHTSCSSAGSSGKSNTGSPLIDGCSPIKSCSVMGLRTPGVTKQFQVQVLQLPFVPENEGIQEEEEEDEENPNCPQLLIQMDTEMFSQESNAATISERDNSSVSSKIHEPGVTLHCTGDLKDNNNTVDMVDVVELAEDDTTWLKGLAGSGSIPTSGMTFNVEISQICLSPLAESSTIPSDSNSIQADSGYNTQANSASSIIDNAGAENNRKDLLDHPTHTDVQSKLLQLKKKMQ
ncbi:protein aurora borealis [Protopterus annectens]|uniref:protein aurora borealis n=1 Tax=Protopterus annectens TaxID=7888 RepID=UPI001CFAEC29|nr:protein aurora borealis [Protopterus annectens]XP_043927678.1 protein aurora borealis [Protopterus annectens]